MAESLEMANEYRDLRECPFRKKRCVASACMFWTAVDDESGYCNFNAMRNSIRTMETATVCVAVMLFILIILILSPAA